MPKRKAAENSTARRAVVAARVVVPSNANPSPGSASGSGSNNNGFGWGSLLSGLPQEPNDEDHEEWVERLFGNEQRGCTSPLHNSLLGNGEGNWGMPGTSQPMQQASPQKGAGRAASGSRRRGGSSGAGGANAQAEASCNNQLVPPGPPGPPMVRAPAR